MNMNEWLKSLLVMSVVFGVLVLLLEFFSFATLWTWDSAQGYFRKSSEDPQSEAVIYGFNKSAEQRNFRSEVIDFKHYNYKAFVEWKNTEFKGQYVNVDVYGRRVTGYEAKYPQTRTIRFFGGSTMWGFGLADESTIPILIGNREKVNTVNYAEQAYNSRQALNVLIENLNSIKKGDLVVFYDGVNDSHNCIEENSTNGHVREGYIREALRKVRLAEKDSADASFSAKALLSYYKKTNTYELIVRAKRKLFGDNSQVETKAEGFVCDDPSKAQEVADFLLTSWRTAEILSKSVGAKFSCVLQPNPYTLTSKPYYYMEGLAQSTRYVYPLVRKQARDLECFVDLSQSLDKDYYVDECCHMNRMGNEELANVLIDKVIRPQFGHAKAVEARAQNPNSGHADQDHHQGYSQKQERTDLVNKAGISKQQPLLKQ
jgi:hypothetical protein